MEFVYDSVGPKPAAREKMLELQEALVGDEFAFHLDKIGTNHVIMVTSKTCKLSYDDAQRYIRTKYVEMRKAKRAAELAAAESEKASEDSSIQ